MVGVKRMKCNGAEAKLSEAEWSGARDSSSARAWMTCVDGGPWPCVEVGCPAPSVTCAILSQACEARFDSIWEVLPDPRLLGAAVQDECPGVCGVCAERQRQIQSQCTLLSRDVLVAADAARDTLEVQRLRFALPDGAVASGPTAHVKVRAPDAPGYATQGLNSGVIGLLVTHSGVALDRQRMRVRAYSMDIDEARSSFNLTVKIYPGGPPHTRGTSAWLGELKVGSTASVPQTRRIEWAVAPAKARRVGVVAFGVGIVECLLPLATLLEAGAEARPAPPVEVSRRRSVHCARPPDARRGGAPTGAADVCEPERAAHPVRRTAA